VGREGKGGGGGVRGRERGGQQQHNWYVWGRWGLGVTLCVGSRCESTTTFSPPPYTYIAVRHLLSYFCFTPIPPDNTHTRSPPPPHPTPPHHALINDGLLIVVVGHMKRAWCGEGQQQQMPKQGRCRGRLCEGGRGGGGHGYEESVLKKVSSALVLAGLLGQFQDLYSRQTRIRAEQHNTNTRAACYASVSRQSFVCVCVCKYAL